jgi:hypothetical protein
MTEYFTRRLSAFETSLFLDELFLASGVLAKPCTGGHRAISPSGEPMLRTLKLPTGAFLIYFSTAFFKEPV